MKPFLLAVAIGLHPVSAICTRYAQEVESLAAKPLLQDQVSAILKANDLENAVCHSPAITDASRLIVARFGLQALHQAEQIRSVRLRATE